MKNGIPRRPATLMYAVYKHIMPRVRTHLERWKREAALIQNKELREQALSSIESKAFHCYGGAVYAFLAGNLLEDAVEFIVAYQTISDYLDNLCDRSTSLDPADFAMLHNSMREALDPDSELSDWYSLRNDSEDHYLKMLVKTCRRIIKKTAPDEAVQKQILRLNELYCALQVHKHVNPDERLERLLSWYEAESSDELQYWQEFAAASGSTLGIFCLISYALSWKGRLPFAKRVADVYFPHIQCLHIMLDYYIDEHEDEQEGDLNFCSFYMNKDELGRRIDSMIQNSLDQTALMPDAQFHAMVIQGLTGLYLSDPKTRRQNPFLKKRWLKMAGPGSYFFYYNSKIYCDLVQKVR
ncbi:tetraprenyl-beta-curcumene synthase family protein [Aciduricibacillus chroicocephali]|uniref:Tetraprenyl-beta-curcumene synthase family protein n=1 Tax=Aciduricibacillus chroicocephali TaxID=3054939 RepID=A0ABY9KU99_9BACI|nr:tetraprenyl-beta-curcumene synthase family protein [Bacillaceae bacterium 44XB]